MIDDSMFVIAVPDLQKSADYYADVMGFEVEEIGDPGWRMYMKDTVHIMAGECPDAIPPADLGDHSYFCYLIVKSADDYHAELQSKQADIINPVEDKPWGMREFGLRTIDGHRIMVGERL